MTPLAKVVPGVRLKGLQPEMAIVLDVVPEVFGRFGYDCWVTSAVRPQSSGLHRLGLALDFDSSTNVPESVGQQIATRVSSYLGDGFDCLWHGPKWHLHVEYDPKDG